MYIKIDDRHARQFFSKLETSQLPFAIANTFNRTMMDAQTEVRQVAYLAAFVQRNTALPKAITTIRSKDFATKRKLSVTMGPVMDGRTGRMAGDGFIERQIKNGTKVAKRTDIAIPLVGKGLRRLSGGSIPAAMKPRKNKKLFKITNGPKTFLVERQKTNGLVFRYRLQHTARPNRKGKFNYGDASIAVIKRNIQSNFNAEFIRALSGMRIKI